MESVIIDWEDSCSLIGGGVWADKEQVETLTPHICQSIGWIAKENDECVVLVSSISAELFSGEICIPKSAIKNRKKL